MLSVLSMLSTSKIPFRKLLAVIPKLVALVEEVREALRDRELSKQEILEIGQKVLAIVALVA